MFQSAKQSPVKAGTSRLHFPLSLVWVLVQERAAQNTCGVNEEYLLLPLPGICSPALPMADSLLFLQMELPWPQVLPEPPKVTIAQLSYFLVGFDHYIV